jgi:hypothetical protein
MKTAPNPTTEHFAVPQFHELSYAQRAALKTSNPKAYDMVRAAHQQRVQALQSALSKATALSERAPIIAELAEITTPKGQ